MEAHTYRTRPVVLYNGSAAIVFYLVGPTSFSVSPLMLPDAAGYGDITLASVLVGLAIDGGRRLHSCFGREDGWVADPWAGVNIEHISSNDACLSPCMEPNDLAMPEWITVGVEKSLTPKVFLDFEPYLSDLKGARLVIDPTPSRVLGRGQLWTMFPDIFNMSSWRRVNVLKSHFPRAVHS